MCPMLVASEAVGCSIQLAARLLRILLTIPEQSCPRGCDGRYLRTAFDLWVGHIYPPVLRPSPRVPKCVDALPLLIFGWRGGQVTICCMSGFVYLVMRELLHQCYVVWVWAFTVHRCCLVGISTTLSLRACMEYACAN